MGNQNSVNVNSPPEPLEDQDVTHLGHLTLMRSAQTLCYLKVLSFSDLFLMEERLRSLKARAVRLKDNPHILNIYSVTRFEKQEICSNNYQLHMYFQCPQQSLSQVLARRLRDKQNFTEDELFVFISKIVDSLLYLQDNGLRNIQLDAWSVYFCGNLVKVLDSGVAYSRCYTALLEQREESLQLNTHFYLAPQLLTELKQLNYDPYISPKADIFSLGMLLLEMITLEPMNGYYDFAATKIDYESLIHRLSRISHSLSLKTLLAEMLQQDPDERIGLVSLKQKVQRIRQSEPTIIRSKSSTMLKDFLAHSRNGSLTKQNQSITRHQSQSERKNIKVMVTSFDSQKQELDRKIVNQQTFIRNSKDKQVIAKGVFKQKCTLLSGHNDCNIDQAKFKNIVKSRLSKRQQNENYPCAEIQAKPTKIHQKIDQAKLIPLAEHHSNNQQVNNLMSSGFSSALQKDYEGIAQPTLLRLVEESGLRSLLKVQQLNEKAKHSQPFIQNTSRFGNYDQARALNDAGHLQKLNEQDTVVKMMQSRKIMTFNSRELANINQNSTRQTDGKCSFTSHLSQKNIQKYSLKRESPKQNIKIKNVPVVVSQEKVYESCGDTLHYEKLQRQLNMMECVQSIERDSRSSYSSELGSISKVQESYTLDNLFSHSHHQPNTANINFTKKGQRKLQLNIQISQASECLSFETMAIPKITNQLRYRNPALITPIDFPQHSKRQSSHSKLHFSFDQGKGLSGSLVLPSGQNYRGQLAGGLPHGNGILESEGNFRYSGSFRDGTFSGFGTLINLKYYPFAVDFRSIDLTRGYWTKFEGEFEAGAKNGFGTIYFGEGEKFSGCLRQNVIQGYGCFYAKGGDLISGLWSENKFTKL